MGIQLLLASVAGILFLLMCLLGIIYLIDAICFKKKNNKCMEDFSKFVGVEGFFDTRKKIFFQSSPKTLIKEFEKCQFPDFSGYVPKIIPCKISAIYPLNRFNPEFSAFVDLDINTPLPIYVKILYVGKEIVVFGNDNIPEIAKSKSFFAKKHIQNEDVVSLDLLIKKDTARSFSCNIVPSKA